MIHPDVWSTGFDIGFTQGLAQDFANIRSQSGYEGYIPERWFLSDDQKLPWYFSGSWQFWLIMNQVPGTQGTSRAAGSTCTELF